MKISVLARVLVPCRGSPLDEKEFFKNTIFHLIKANQDKTSLFQQITHGVLLEEHVAYILLLLHQGTIHVRHHDDPVR